ncbi:TetR family transcriptional regulator [Microbacterium sp. No. 7]|uniref:TetR family transcriptional regulator n=1 Tax=Microbacterium sp. No. 7 TaxID=1714373 RepID=UPI0006D245FC|nr:TetR family transcriptional regulator [Microbacterium sp. No. 7]
MALTNQLGEVIRAARREQSISARALADRLGISAGTMSAIENGHASLSVDRLLRISELLSIDLSQLLATASAGRAGDAAQENGADPSSADRSRDWRTFDALAADPVITAAVKCFVERGYHGSSMRAIADAAGISVPGVYHHYASKQELLVRILDLTMDDLEWRLVAARAGASGPRGRLAALVEALALYHARRPQLAFIGASEMRSIEEPERTRIARRRTEVQHMIDREIADAISAGEASSTLPLAPGRAIVTACTSLPQWFDGAGRTSAEEIAAEYARLALAMVHAD